MERGATLYPISKTLWKKVNVRICSEIDSKTFSQMTEKQNETMNVFLMKMCSSFHNSQ
jgi:hypothetical protein